MRQFTTLSPVGVVVPGFTAFVPVAKVRGLIVLRTGTAFVTAEGMGGEGKAEDDAGRVTGAEGRGFIATGMPPGAGTVGAVGKGEEDGKRWDGTGETGRGRTMGGKGVRMLVEATADGDNTAGDDIWYLLRSLSCSWPCPRPLLPPCC